MAPKRKRDEEPALSEPKYPKIFDGKFYEIVEWDISTKRVVAKCTNCDKKEIKGNKHFNGSSKKAYN